MARTSSVPEQSATMDTAATILPGVPLPRWALPAEPVLPAPAPEPEPVPEPAPRAMAMAGAPAAVADAVAAPAPSAPPPAPAPAPPAPPTPMPVAEVASVAAVAAAPLDVPAPPRPHSHRREGSAPSPLDEPVPALAPAAPTPTRAEAYAAAGAAPSNAPWGTPPAPAPADVATDPAPSTADDLADLDAGPDLEPETVEAAASPRSRRPLVLIGAVGGALVLGAVACFVWPGFLVAQDTPVPQPVRSAPPVAAAVTLTAPASVNGLTLLPGAPAAALTKAATSTRLVGYTAPVAAVYGTGTTPRATIIGWKAAAPGTAADVSTAFAGFQGATGQPVLSVTPVPTGTLGGSMSCGTSTVGGTPASVCFWSDATTFGAVTVLKPPTATDGSAMAIAIRTAVETTG